MFYLNSLPLQHLKGWIFFFEFVYLTRHRISITLVSIQCLDHVQNTSGSVVYIKFTKVNNM